MIETQLRGLVCIVRLAHLKANTVDIEILQALQGTLAELKKASVRAVVLTGQGGVFSAGVDLMQVLEGGVSYIQRLWRIIDETLEKMLLFPKPVVAAVNGHAIAGGCVLVQACDYRIMSLGRSKIGVPELLVGVPFPRLALELVRAGLPAARLHQAIYLGRNYDAEGAEELGLIDESVRAEHLLDRAIEVADRLALVPPRSFAAAKRDVRAPVLRAFQAGDDSLIKAALADEETFACIREFAQRTLGRS